MVDHGIPWSSDHHFHLGLTTGYTSNITTFNKPGAIARSEAMSLESQKAPRSILASGTSFREVEQLSVNGERMCTKYWLPASGRLAQEQCE